MRQLIDVAERLRDVRAAQERFLWRWHFEELFVGPEVLDQVADDVDRVPAALFDAWDGTSGTLHFPDPLVDEP